MKTIKLLQTETCSHINEDKNYQGFITPFWGLNFNVFRNGDVLCIRLSNTGRRGWNIIRLSDDEFYFNPIDEINVLDHDSYRKYVGIVKMSPEKVLNFFQEKLAPLREDEHRKGVFWRSETSFYIREYSETERTFIKAREEERDFKKHGFVTYTKTFGKRKSSHFFSNKDEQGMRPKNPEESIYFELQECLNFLQEEIENKKSQQKKYVEMGGTVTVISRKGMAVVKVANGSLKSYDSSEIITPKGTVLQASSYGSGRNFGYSYGKTGELELSKINWENYYVAGNDTPDLVTQVFGCRNGAPDNFTDS